MFSLQLEGSEILCNMTEKQAQELSDILKHDILDNNLVTIVCLLLYFIQWNLSKLVSLYNGIPSVCNMASGPKSSYTYRYK